MPNTKYCTCEHNDHFDPKSTGKHAYGSFVTELVELSTPFGTFCVCPDCRDTCLASYKTEA